MVHRVLRMQRVLALPFRQDAHDYRGQLGTYPTHSPTFSRKLITDNINTNV